MEVKLRPFFPEALLRIETPTPRLRGQGRWSLAYILTAVGTTALLLASCTPAPMPAEILHRNQTATAQALPHGGGIETPYVNPERAATAEAATPSPEASPTAKASITPTPESKKCLVLDDCSQVKFFIKPNAAGEDVLYAGANLKAGTFVYARRDGQRGAINFNESLPQKGTRITIRDPNLNDPEGVDYVTGDIIPTDSTGLKVDYNSIPVKKGDIIGKIGDSGVKNDGYNYVHTIGKVGATGKATTGIEELKQAYANIPPVETINRIPKDEGSQFAYTSGPALFKD